MANLEHYDDNSVFGLIAKDDEKALEELFKRYFYRLCHYVDQIVRNRACPEEVISDVFITIWLKRKEISIHTSVKSYLFRAAKNSALNALDKSFGNSPMVSLDEIEAGFCSHSFADDHLRLKELQNEVNDLIHRLPEQQKVILRLNKVEGFSPSEISDLLDITQKTVYNNLYEAVKFLASNYKKTITSFVFLVFLLLS